MTIRTCSTSLISNILFVLFISLAPNLNAAELVDRVVAVVNSDVITMSEVNEEGAGYFKQLSDKAPPAQLEDAMIRARGEILDNLIDKKIIAHEADKQGIKVSDAEVEAAAQQVISNNNTTRELFDIQLDQNGMTYESYLDSLRNQILQSKLVNYEVRSKIIITDNMILDYYDTNYTQHISESGYYLMQMGFIWGKAGGSSSEAAQYADKTDARKRAERVHALVTNGQDFRILAQKFSDLPSAADGGDLGVFEKDDMAPYMRDAVLDLQPGSISKIVETPSGFQFFKLLSSQNGNIIVQASFESVKEEIRKKLYEEELAKQFEEWVENIKKQAYIKKL
ncbi:MAG: SurA N-terminal domain-containing protein [Desulfocapsa sp.]|nr:SurA N-terminal domain-containing protein [Desulfocapsa sp.]